MCRDTTLYQQKDFLMRSSKLKLTAMVAAALIGIVGTLSSAATAEVRNHRNGGNFQQGLSQSHVNRGGNWQNRYYGGKRQFRNYGYNGYDGNYGNSYGRRYGRNNGFGIYLNLGDNNSSGCSYSYRKWQNTGSRYWRSRYYNCVG
jgi:hypothetical protein